MDVYFCAKKEGLEKHVLTSWKLVMAINGLIEDSSLKYDIVNLQSGFRLGDFNLGGSGTPDWQQVHLQRCKASP